MSAIYSILLTIDGAIYDLISSMFTIFNFLAKTDLFSNDLYGQIVRRMYVILGMIMMFALAYSLLKAVINPDEFSKGENSFPKLIKNVVISLGIIAVLPTVFTVAFNIQNSILNYDTIPKLVLGEDYNSQVYQEPGRSIAFNTYSAFLHVNEDKCEAKSSSDTILTEEQIKNCGNNIVANTGNRHWYNLWLFPDASSQSFTEVVNSVNSNNISFANFNQFSDAVTKGEISYIPVVSTICGLFLLYVLVNFCFDMAVRVVKLMFFQIIAPIPVVCRVIPGGKMKDVFSTWTKKTISTFIDVFIRIFIMYIGVFVIKTVIDNWDNIMLGSNLTSGLGLIAKALIIMGVIIFIRQAPKLLADMFHLDTGDMKLGIMDKLAAGGGVIAASAVSGAGLGAIRNFAKSRREKKGVISSFGSAVTGGLVSGVGSGYNARKAKSFADLKSATSKGLSSQVAMRDKIGNYIAKRKNEDGGVSGALWDDFTGWLTGKGVEDLDRIITASGDVNKANDAFRAAIKKQWDKHSTDGAIVYDAGTDIANNFFKGAGNERMFELYNSYRDSNGRMMDASFIKGNIEQRKAEMRNRDLNYYINQERQRLEGTLPNREDFYSSMTDSNGNRIFNEAAYNQALSNYNNQILEIERTAQVNYDRDLSDLSYLDSMYTQLEKKSITELGCAALEGREVGTIHKDDFFEARELGDAALGIIRDSGLEQYDPAKQERVEVKNGDYAAFIDDMAAAASKQSGHATREKQKYLEKKKNS